MRCLLRLPEPLRTRSGTDQLNQGMLYPPQSNILETEIVTAARVLKVIFDNDLARVERPADLEAFIRSHVYKPEYCLFA